LGSPISDPGMIELADILSPGRQRATQRTEEATITIVFSELQLKNATVKNAAGRPKSCGKDARWKSQQRTFPSRLENASRFPLSHSYDCYWCNEVIYTGKVGEN
jgi:hypothetical protein